MDSLLYFQALELCILTEGRMAQALREFVEKDEKEAISALVKWQLDQAQKHLKARRNVREDNIETEVVKHTEAVRQREEEDDTRETEDIRKVNNQSKNPILAIPNKIKKQPPPFCSNLAAWLQSYYLH